VRFLEQAHRLTVLRQSGAPYQFRHVSLQLRLAERYLEAVAPARRDDQPQSASRSLGQAP
jgi:hypothetical protein